MKYDMSTRKRWMRTITVGAEVDVKYNNHLYRTKVTRIGKRLVWVRFFQLVDGSPIHPHSLRFDKKTGEGWGTGLFLFPINDLWEKESA